MCLDASTASRYRYHYIMYKFIYSIKLLNPNKFVFILLSIQILNYASVVLTDSVSKSIDNNNYGISIFIQLDRMIATVDHTLLLYELTKLGFRETLLDLLSIIIDKDTLLILLADCTSSTFAAKYINTCENKLNMYEKLM